MAVFKINKTDDYTVMSNTHLRDTRLSLKAKGLLSIMLSLPPTWDYSVKGIVAIVKESKSAVESALKELKEFGYLIITKVMPNNTKSGKIEYIYNIYEQPQKQEVENQGLENQGVENQGLEIQGVENQPQLNTNKLNTNKLNTDKLSIDNITTTTAASDEENEDDEYKLNLMGGSMGKGVVMLSDRQFDSLCEKMSKDEVNAYVEKLADFILDKTQKNGSPPKIKSHYKKILEWVEEDRAI